MPSHCFVFKLTRELFFFLFLDAIGLGDTFTCGPEMDSKVCVWDKIAKTTKPWVYWHLTIKVFFVVV